MGERKLTWILTYKKLENAGKKKFPAVNCKEKKRFVVFLKDDLTRCRFFGIDLWVLTKKKFFFKDYVTMYWFFFIDLWVSIQKHTI